MQIGTCIWRLVHKTHASASTGRTENDPNANFPYCSLKNVFKGLNRTQPNILYQYAQLKQKECNFSARRYEVEAHTTSSSTWRNASLSKSNTSGYIR